MTERTYDGDSLDDVLEALAATWERSDLPQFQPAAVCLKQCAAEVRALLEAKP